MEQFTAYMEETVRNLQRKEQALAQSDRKDEANMVKIQINIYGVCRTIYEAVRKNSLPEEVEKAYLQKIDRLPENWELSLEKARAHGDVEKILVEELKLEAWQDVKEAFLRLGAH